MKRPRRITQHHIKTGLLTLKHLRESQPPVKETLTSGNAPDKLGYFRINLPLMGGNQCLVSGNQMLMLGILGHKNAAVYRSSSSRTC